MGQPRSLDQTANGQCGMVRTVNAPAHAPEWSGWLEELGFTPGERVVVMTRSLPGGDPLVVRVGQSTFALRRAEAACIEVDLHTATAPAATVKATA